MRIRILGSLAAALLAVPLAASAQTAGSSSQPQATAQQNQQKQQNQQAQLRQLEQPPTQQEIRSIDPGEVLAQLHQINRNEIAAAQMALQKGQSKDVKDMARQIINDHQRLDRQVLQVAQQQNIQLKEPFSLPGAAHEQAVKNAQQQLSRLSGQEFDKAWLAAQPILHDYALAVVQFGRQANFSEQGVNQLLAQAEQNLQQHQQHASRMLEQKLRVASTPQARTTG